MAFVDRKRPQNSGRCPSEEARQNRFKQTNSEIGRLFGLDSQNFPSKVQKSPIQIDASEIPTHQGLLICNIESEKISEVIENGPLERAASRENSDKQTQTVVKKDENPSLQISSSKSMNLLSSDVEVNSAMHESPEETKEKMQTKEFSSPKDEIHLTSRCRTVEAAAHCNRNRLGQLGNLFKGDTSITNEPTFKRRVRGEAIGFAQKHVGIELRNIFHEYGVSSNCRDPLTPAYKKPVDQKQEQDEITPFSRRDKSTDRVAKGKKEANLLSKNKTRMVRSLSEHARNFSQPAESKDHSGFSVQIFLIQSSMISL